jgi:C-terminal processing protease CtpA/Prc
MTASANERSVVIAGLGLRLGTQAVDMGQGAGTPQEDSVNSGRVFVTELLPGGAAERSNLLRLNDEILHVDHVETTGRSVVSSTSEDPRIACLKFCLYGS